MRSKKFKLTLADNTWHFAKFNNIPNQGVIIYGMDLVLNNAIESGSGVFAGVVDMEQKPAEVPADITRPDWIVVGVKERFAEWIAPTFKMLTKGVECQHPLVLASELGDFGTIDIAVIVYYNVINKNLRKMR
jgi:hypothetical protein